MIRQPKLPLRWYNEPEEQQFRNITEHTAKDFYVIRDDTVFVPQFQIKRDQRGEVITRWDLVNYTNGAVTDLTPYLLWRLDIQTATITEDGEDYIYDWLVHDSFPLPLASEAGFYYMIVSDGIETWYSEIFELCDLFTNLLTDWTDVTFDSLEDVIIYGKMSRVRLCESTGNGAEAYSNTFDVIYNEPLEFYVRATVGTIACAYVNFGDNIKFELRDLLGNVVSDVYTALNGHNYFEIIPHKTTTVRLWMYLDNFEQAWQTLGMWLWPKKLDDYTIFEWYDVKNFCSILYNNDVSDICCIPVSDPLNDVADDDFRNRLIIETSKPISPFYALDENVEEDDKKNKSRLITTMQKFYRFDLAGGHHLTDAFALVRSHQTIKFYLATGEVIDAYDFSMVNTAINEYCDKIDIEFREKSCSKTGCTYDIMDVDWEFVFHDSDELAHEIFSMVTDRTTPTIWYSNGKSYCVFQKREGTPYDCNSMIFAYYHLTGAVSDNYLCVEGFANGQDDHASPVVIVADDGHIIVAREKLLSANPATGHNSAIYICRSDHPEDETSWVNALAHDADYFSIIGDDINNRLAYPNMAKLLNGDLFIWARDIVHKIRIFKSTDNGISWDGFGTGEANGLVVYDPPAATYMCYESQIRDRVSDKLHMIIYPHDTATGTWVSLYYLWSYDGITWRNVADTWNKNIVTAGAITDVEAQANLLVFNAVAPESLPFRSGCLDYHNRPHIIVVSYNTFNLYHYWWTGAAWSSDSPDTDFPDFQYGGSSVILANRALSNNFDLCAPRDPFVNLIYSFYGAEDFITWIWEKNISSVDSLGYAQFTFNYKDARYCLYAFVNETDANYSDFWLLAEKNI